MNADRVKQEQEAVRTMGPIAGQSFRLYTGVSDDLQWALTEEEEYIVNERCPSGSVDKRIARLEFLVLR